MESETVMHCKDKTLMICAVVKYLWTHRDSRITIHEVSKTAPLQHNKHTIEKFVREHQVPLDPRPAKEEEYQIKTMIP